MDVRKQRPPNLEPTWNDPFRPYDHDGHPKTAFRVARSPGLAPSPLTPTGFPMLMDHSGSEYDRAVVQKLDPRGRPTPVDDKLVDPRPPSAEGTCLTAGLRGFTVATPTDPKIPDKAAALLNRNTLPMPPTLLSETRSILLAGLSDSKVSALVSPVTRGPVTRGPPIASAPIPVPRRDAFQTRQQLRAWGHVYLGNAVKADVFVTPVALRDQKPSSSESSDIRHAISPDVLTVRARVRPRSLQRKPFVIQRDFNVAELRATLPEPAASLPDRTQRRHSVQLPPRAAPHSTRRRPSVASISVPPGVLPSVEMGRAMLRGSDNTVPIRKLPWIPCSRR